MSILALRSARSAVSTLALITALGALPAAAQTAAPLPELRVEARRAAPPARLTRPARPAPRVVRRPLRPQQPAISRAPVVAPVAASVPATPVTLIGEGAMVQARASSADTTQLLTQIPGVALATGGGVSALPVIHGMADERNRILLGGVEITSACANHMNPALSYSTPTLAGKAEVLSTNVPVSKGGDSIGSTIIVSPPDPQFAAGGPSNAASTPDRLVSGSLTTAFNSVRKGTTLSGTATIATRAFSLTYAGAWARGDNYEAGNGRKVLSTAFSAQNHAVLAAYRNDGHLITLRGTYQDIPKQGFPNQRMDMLGNEGKTLNANYKGAFGWGQLEANAYWHNTRHYMNFLKDKGGSTALTGMPMRTDGTDFGYSVKGDVRLNAANTLRLGTEFHGQRLDDWWDPVAGMSPGMCCNTYWNINGGQRDRIGTFAELETKWNKEWTTIFGLRNDIVMMDTGRVQGYSNVNTGVGMMGPVTVNYLADSTAFNTAKRAKTDVNFDFSAVARYEPSTTASYEAGITRKTRAPSLYERYAWSKGSPRFGMAANMTNWFGDANGYVGNLNLKPEIANTASISAIWRDPSREVWEVKVTPYVSYVQNYIDADKLWDQLTRMGGATPFVTLQFANHDALLSGVDLSGRVRLMNDPRLGRLSLSGFVGYVRGRNLDTHQNLYHIMPISGKMALEHAIALYGGTFTSALEVEAVGAKDQVNATRKELTTPAYALINLRSSYSIANLRFDLGVENLMNRQYYTPMGGANFTAYKAAGSIGRLGVVPGPGRAIYGAMTVKF